MVNDDRPHLACVLMGEESLLVQCGEILAERGHEIRAIIADDPHLVRWAMERQIRALDPRSDLASQLRDTPFDCFFSITNLRIVGAELLALPRLHAINFHDGPLPEYAGVNTPVWGLLDGAPEWGSRGT
jgi:methionyl-tRNA formyltransferase